MTAELSTQNTMSGLLTIQTATIETCADLYTHHLNYSMQNISGQISRLPEQVYVYMYMPLCASGDALLQINDQKLI